MLCCFTRRLWLDTRPRCSPSASLTSCQWILSHVAPTCFSCGRYKIWIGCKEKTSWNRSGGTDVCTLLAGREHECVASKFWRHVFLRVRRWSLHIYTYIFVALGKEIYWWGLERLYDEVSAEENTGPLGRNDSVPSALLFHEHCFLSIMTGAIQCVCEQRDAAGRFLAEVLRRKDALNRG